MSFLLFLFGSGYAFLLGAALVLVGFVVRLRTKRKLFDRAAVYGSYVGLILVGLSAVPLPYWLHGLLLLVSLVSLTSPRSESPAWVRYRHWIRASFLGAWIFALVLEVPYFFSPVVTLKDETTVYVIGDSITAGLEEKFPAWPKLLDEHPLLAVHNLARAGATTSQALKQSSELPDEAEVVILEIGGNDLLGGTSAEQFGRDLEQLIVDVKRRSEVVLMFELPLPPTYNDYGLVQRRLARKYQIRLIPKRILMGVLSGSEATSDTIHLTASGHAQLAEEVSAMMHVK